MTTAELRRQVAESLGDPEYREAFVEEAINTGLASQIRALQHDRGWTQEELAARAGMKQETISRLENMDYGRHTLSTLKRLAKAFDVALTVRFAPFSELVDWVTALTPQRLAPLGFGAEAASQQEAETEETEMASASGQWFDEFKILHGSHVAQFVGVKRELATDLRHDFYGPQLVAGIYVRGVATASLGTPSFRGPASSSEWKPTLEEAVVTA